MEVGDSLRIEVRLDPQDAQTLIYQFGTLAYRSAPQTVPCLLASATPTTHSRWSWDPARQAILGGEASGVQVEHFCPGPQQPTIALRFAPAIDPAMPYIGVFIARSAQGADFRFQRQGAGHNVGNADSFVRTLSHLVTDPPFGLILIGAPRPFITLSLANLVELLPHLDCVEVR